MHRGDAMNVTEYSFGRIVIDGSSYSSDVIIRPDKVIDGWWRKQGHKLQIDDLDDVISVSPEILVVGTGCYGNMRVPEETVAFLENNNIIVKQAVTGDAVKLFNELQKECANTVAALHLTC